MPSPVMVLPDVEVALLTNLPLNSAFNAAIGGRLYTNVKPGTTYPYAVLRCRSDDDGDKSQSGERIGIEVHVWSRHHGPQEAMAIGKAAYAALHRQPAMASSATVKTSLLTHDGTGLTVDSDGITRHLIARFHTRSQSTTQE